MKPLTAILILIGLSILIGQMDFADAQSEQDYTCEMIQNGYWPASVGDCDED